MSLASPELWSTPERRAGLLNRDDGNVIDPRTLDPETRAYVEARYGLTRTRPWLLPGMVTIVAAVALTWLGWAAWGQTRVVREQALTYEVLSDTRVSLKFEVVRPDGQRLGCTVRARDGDGLEVGRAEVILVAGQTLETRTVLITTTGRASTAEVLGCG